ncbi:hypothetical protein K270103H11_01200 [Gordonibacter urolithinfaciens]
MPRRSAGYAPPPSLPAERTRRSRASRSGPTAPSRLQPARNLPHRRRPAYDREPSYRGPPRLAAAPAARYGPKGGCSAPLSAYGSY